MFTLKVRKAVAVVVDCEDGPFFLIEVDRLAFDFDCVAGQRRV